MDFGVHSIARIEVADLMMGGGIREIYSLPGAGPGTGGHPEERIYPLFTPPNGICNPVISTFQQLE